MPEASRDSSLGTFDSNMRAAFCISAILTITGIFALWYAVSLPVYTDKNAPSRLADELQHLPYEEGTHEWFKRLPDYETPHKAISDAARSLISLGVTISLACGLIDLYIKRPFARTKWFIIVAWVLLWGLKYPFSLYFYFLRMVRYDYPPWADSIMIAIFSDWVTWTLGCILTTLIIFGLLYGRRLADSCLWVKPNTIMSSIRAVFILLWITLLGFLLLISINPGDEGMIISCGLAIPLLWFILLATKYAEQAGAVNPHACGTSGISAAEQPRMPEASGDT